MNQNEAGDNETIKTEKTQHNENNTTKKNDEPNTCVEFLLEENTTTTATAPNKTQSNDKIENSENAASSEARMSMASENNAVEQFPVSNVAETNTANDCGEHNSPLSLIATTNATSIITTAALTETTASSTAAALTPTTTAINMPYLSHVASAPSLGATQIRANQQQQQKIKNYHDAKQTALWDTTSTSTGGTILKGSICSVYATPRIVRKSSESGNLGSLPRRVSFPKSDTELVTGYLEPANPWEHVSTVNSTNEIVDLYTKSCHKHNTKPLTEILEHLKAVELNKLLRQPSLSLKNTKLLPGDCEALEEVLKRVQYKCIDLSSCELEESALNALCDIIEYYEAANELNISSNPKGMTTRGWSSCANMVGRSQALQVLNAEGNPISKSSAECLGNALCTSNLHTVKLEHCGLKGPPLMGLCLKIRHNRVLKELWLAHNDLDSRDAESIAELLRFNHFLELVDISNNNIGDEGLKHIVEALIVQSKELERRSVFQRAAAIQSDDIFSPVETTPIEEPFKMESNVGDINESTEEVTEIMLDSNCSNAKDKTVCALIPGLEEFTIEIEMLPTTTAIVVDENEAEDDTEDTVKTNIVKIKQQQNSVGVSSGCGGGGGGVGGQSMLDKLLSMNSDSSSEEAASNLSTDTIAACGSEDASFVSDDIFDLATTTAALTTTITPNSKADNLLTLMSISSVSASSEPIGISSDTLHNCAEITQKNDAQTIGCGDKNILCDTCTLEAKNYCNCSGNKVADIGFNVGDVEKTSKETTNKSATNDKNHNNNNNRNNNNNTNNNNNNNSNIVQIHQNSQTSPPYDKRNDESAVQPSHPAAMPINKDDIVKSACVHATVYEIIAEDNDCLVPCTSNNKPNALMLQGAGSAAVDVNKNSRMTDDYDDTHSTDSAFESASEGDISRHLPEEFTRFSTSLESTRLDDITSKELVAIETATIATESTESLLEATTGDMTQPNQPLAKIGCQKSDEVKTKDNVEVRFAEPLHETASNATSHVPPSSAVPSSNTKFESVLPKVTIESESVKFAKICEENPSPIPTPPPPATSPGGVGLSMRRTDSSCNFITQSTRNHSHSSDSLCSDNSLDGSVSSELNLSTSNERFTKNDTLTRQLRQLEASTESTSTRSPAGLKALAVWNNNLTKDSGLYISDLLSDTSSLELLNIGKNILSNDFISCIKESLTKNTTLTTMGLQSAHLSASGIETLAAILSFGGNSTLQRIDIRDNKLEVESLNTLSEALKSNTTVTQIDIDDEPKRLSVGSDAHVQYTRVVENVRSMCSRNEKTLAQLQAEKTANTSGVGKRRSGYYVGSRKISLTCHSRPLIEYSVAPAVAMPSSGNKLEVKRKSGVRLRSPVPSPPNISPSSSPSRSRFQVCRVTESSPLTSPLAQTPPPVSVAVTVINQSVAIPMPLSSSVNNSQQRLASMSSSSSALTASTSLPSMATAVSSTQTIKRPSSSRSSRFHVSKIYEDPKVPLAKRSLPPITTPPIHLPPSPMLKSAPKNEAAIDTTALDEKINRRDNDSNSSSSNNSTLTSSSTSTVKNVIVVEDIAQQRIQTARCPIAIFNENDITLTHDSANEILLTAAATAASAAIPKKSDTSCTTNSNSEIDGGGNDSSGTQAANSDTNLTANPATQQVTRKLSCPTAVDKLLTLFNPVAIFQRSTSPEPPKMLTSAPITESTNTAIIAIPATTLTTTAPTVPTSAATDLNSIVKQPPPTWSKLGSDILNLSVGETEKPLAIEQPRSFLDAASKQLRDLGKQVFRQNTTTGTTATTVPATFEYDRKMLKTGEGDGDGEGNFGELSENLAEGGTMNMIEPILLTAFQEHQAQHNILEDDDCELKTLLTQTSNTKTKTTPIKENTRNDDNSISKVKNSTKNDDTNNF